MKKLSFKATALAAGVLVVLAVAIVYFSSGSKSAPLAPSAVDPAFGEYIASYSSGVLSSQSNIRIVLVDEAIDSTMIGQESSVKLFSLSPVVGGKAYWLDTRTVEFRPDHRLASGQVYSVGFNLSKLMSVPEGLHTFTFNFQVIPQNYELTVENMVPYVKTDLKRQKIEGTVHTADYAEDKKVEQAFTATQEGKALTVSWTHGGGGQQHHFVVEEVARKEEASKVLLAVKGESLGVDRPYEKPVEIPSLRDFKLMATKVVQNPTQYVVLQFSDPLQEKQQLNGLIRLEQLDGLDFEIHDNEIRVYPPSRQAGTKMLYLAAGIRNVLDYRMKMAATAEVVFEQLKPEVRFTGKGTILPSTDGLILPFEAVNLNKVDVTVVKIFEKNVLQFLQVNDLGGSYEMRRVSKRIARKTISLETAGVTDLGKWNRFTLDLAEIIRTEPGAIYQVKIGYRKAYSTYTCEDGSGDASEGMTSFDDDEVMTSYYDAYDDYDDYYYYYDDYDWRERDNPCNSAYYHSHHGVTRNVLASDLGLTAKYGSDGNAVVFVTDIKTTEPMAGVEVALYDFQQQPVGKGTTTADGKVILKTTDVPYVLVANKDTQRGYLRMRNGESLSMSQFDVSGEQVQQGIKGFLYGDRGVWRPGDSLYLTFILEDKNHVLPPTHPVVFELQNPQGQLVTRLVRSSGTNGFYDFATSTPSDAPTGNWTGRVKVGGTTFTQVLKVETVKPNRLKINLDFGTERFTSPEITGQLTVNWLHGSPGRNLKATFDVLLATVPTRFKKYDDYVFEDPARDFYSESQTIFEGYTNEEGKATVTTTLSSSSASPGFLKAIFRGKVYEESGNFSIDNFSVPYSPYRAYVGLKVPDGEAYSNIIYTDKTQTIDLVTVDADGKAVDAGPVDVRMYKLDTRWWWDYSYGSVANYISRHYSDVFKTGKVNMQQGKGSWSFKVETADWGRYYIQVTNPATGHSTGKIVYLDEPGWYSRYRASGNTGAAMLAFTTDKTTYKIGEQVNITIPGSASGRALVSLENGTKVLQTFWVNTQEGDTPFSFEATPEMAPNIFVNVSLLQPHAQTANDLPIRLYGVVPVRVEDPNTHLQPVIDMPAELEPGQEVTIKVSEQSDRKMTYTVAVVDEGLLDITRFKTPDPWSRFYAREALGVRSWDMFDQVMGAFGARVERLLSIGGDAEMAAKEDDAKANRFKPVVKYFGPFTLDGGTGKHTFTMPQYIGSVRTMVVAGNDGAYGQAEKATPVRKPLMVLATLPRVLGPEEKVTLPITLFTADKSIRNVKVDIKVSGPVAVHGDAQRSVAVGSMGDMTIDFDLDVKSAAGVARIEVSASSGSFKASDVIEIDVRNPNPMVTRVTGNLLEAGKSWQAEVLPVGIAGTNTAVLEVSNLPPINLESRLRYLLQYPHGCVEQTTSSVFPQLYVGTIKVLTEREQALIQRNVTAGIERLRSFVQSDGGFSYWPGGQGSNPWGSSYAGHFLVEAQAKGFYVPEDMIRAWKKYQRSQAQSWRHDERYYSSDLMQAYRLYTLAVANAPELGAMNRLREAGSLSSTAAWTLAAAYAKAGQPEAAKKIVANFSTEVKPYREMGYCYGSNLRDKALILETLVLLNQKEQAFEMLQALSEYLSNTGYWMSTQEVAYSLKAVSTFAGTNKRGALSYTYTLDGKTVKATSERSVSQVTIPVAGAKKSNVSVVNEGGGNLFVRVISQGIPARGEETDEQKNLDIQIRYTDTKGNVIDPSRLDQGTEFVAEVTVKHPGIFNWYENMALAQVFPSGWEINNLRLDGTEEFLTSDSYTYQDIRDDRVYTYFDLSRGSKKVFRVLLTATYAGTFYLPATSCEAMYDNSKYARRKGMTVEVVKPAALIN